MHYQSDKPYPIPRVEKPNFEYAKLLLEDYAGNISEDTAIHLYLFQSLMANNELQEFANAMEHISKVEMHHLKLLGETIKLLGINPVYGVLPNDNMFRFWNSSNVNYDINLKTMIENDIKSEQQAINNYRYHLSLINDKYVKQLISRIIEDEEIHIQVFNSFYQKYF